MILEFLPVYILADLINDLVSFPLIAHIFSLVIRIVLKITHVIEMAGILDSVCLGSLFIHIRSLHGAKICIFGIALLLCGRLVEFSGSLDGTVNVFRVHPEPAETQRILDILDSLWLQGGGAGLFHQFRIRFFIQRGGGF